MSESDIMVFEPTMDEFRDFNKYIDFMESKGAHKIGVAKVIPPPQWVARKAGYEIDHININISSPLRQVVTGRKGVYSLKNQPKGDISFQDFIELSNSEKFAAPNNLEYEELERVLWKNAVFGKPLYAADVVASLTDLDVKEWNLNKLGSVLDSVDTGHCFEGVHTPNLYIGMWKTFFPWHTEDMDLYSISYLHYGSAKTWYSIPPQQGHKFEAIMEKLYPGSAKQCPAFMRHKEMLVSPNVLRTQSLTVNKINQHAGEFIITFPFGYHSGYNNGLNIAEACNFATPRWVEYGKNAALCRCYAGLVQMPMDNFVKKFQPERYESWVNGGYSGSHPEHPSSRSSN